MCCACLSDKDLTQDQIDAYKDRYFMNVNYYDNSKKNGVELAELRFDYFTSYRLQSMDYRSTGMQYVGNYRGNDIINADDKSRGFNTIFSGDRYLTDDDMAAEWVDPDFYYYDTTNGISWNGQNFKSGSVATELKRATQFIIKIDNRPFMIQLTGSWYADIGDLRNIFGIGWKTGDIYSKQYWTYSSVFKTVLKAVKTNSAGYGNWYITVDLSNYFTIREFDTETGKFKTDNVTDIIKNYCVLKFNYNANGAISSSQSMFGLIENNRKFAYGEGVDYDTNYWQERMVYNLKIDNLDLRYDETYGGYFVSLSLITKKLFEDMSRAEVNIVLIITGKNIVGLDYNAFEDVKLKSLWITGPPQDFYLLDNCLKGTELQTFEHTGINIIGGGQ